jgi:hypothetical protein
VIENYLVGERAQMTAHPEVGVALISGNGEKPSDPSLPQPDIAATAMMVHLLMDFSETTMKP